MSKGVVLDEIESMQIDNEQELEIIDFISKKFNYQWLNDIFQDKKIKCIFSDIDGVFSKNQKTLKSNERIYSTLDSSAIKRWTNSNNLFFFISSETIPHSKDLFSKLSITDSIFNSKDKLSDVKKLQEKYILKNDDCIYLGNDESDIACLNHFNTSFAPIDANPMASRESQFIIEKNGGDGFLQDVINLII